ncbi:MAG: Lytic transglycosylase catalytic [Verrucomicrobia bacterium]|nr:Lytic transglycosylase catalytic [Verrucomicrobiota bacterium]
MRTIRFILIVLLVAGCRRHAKIEAVSLPTRIEIWEAIQPIAARYRVSPEFIYALIAAESNFDPRAQNGNARGLLQIKPRAWRTVSAANYEKSVFDWKQNLEVGIDYLAYSRAYLHRKTTFSYPLLLAAFHYGLEYVEERKFNVGRIDCPDNAIYRELWSGNLAPVRPPMPIASR